jgi:predicted nucleic acid-binding protein
LKPDCYIIAYTPKLRQLGFDLYKQRSDKGYSLTDCISMAIMQQMGITDVLTHDKHFTQEGFHILFYSKLRSKAAQKQ